MTLHRENPWLIVDSSSIMWSCLLAGKDKEFGKTVSFDAGDGKGPKDFHVNSAAYGFDNLVNHFNYVFTTLSLAPMDMLLVIEGLNSKSYRQAIYSGYKAGRDRPDEAYEQFQILRKMVLDTYLGLGAIGISQDGIESDDVIGYLCKTLPGRKIIDSNDGDLYQFISDGSTGTEGVELWKLSKNQLFREENPAGPFQCRFIPLYKALVGDTSDKLPGAKGFGEKSWLDLLCNYQDGELEVLESYITNRKLGELADDVKDFKPFQKVIDNAEMVYKSYLCARSYTNMVNTARKPLVYMPGMTRPHHEFDDERLKPWAQQVRLVHAGNFKQAIDWMTPLLQESPFISFDIETSSNDTADQWLETAKTKSNESKDAESVDVFGAELCSFSLTFGRNMQYTLFFTVSHVETDKIKNLTKAQAKQVLERLPKSKVKAIQNVSFELPVVMNELGPLQEAA